MDFSIVIDGAGGTRLRIWQVTIASSGTVVLKPPLRRVMASVVSSWSGVR